MSVRTGSRIRGLGLVLLAAGLTLIGAEACLHVYVHSVLREGRLNRNDPVLGWTLIPNNRLERRVEAGFTIDFATDRNGHRVAPGDTSDAASAWRAHDGRRVLIVGDSFVEGIVNFEDRFDQLVAAKHAEWAILALGCQGYGTDQEVLVARRFVHDLRPDDILVLMTCGNDFHDILRSEYFARAKPRYELANGQLVLHKPRIGMQQRLRGISHAATFLCLRLSKTRVAFTETEMADARALYPAIVRSLSDELISMGVVVVIAHHSNWMSGDNSDVIAALCRDAGLHELALDNVVLGVRREKRENLLADGIHWSVAGNKPVADTLGAYLDDIVNARTH